MPFTAEEVLASFIKDGLEQRGKRPLSEDEKSVVAELARRLLEERGDA